MQNIKLYKNALSFNNMGIFLLENGFYEDSMISFQQAIYCMKVAYTYEVPKFESECYYSERVAENDVDLHFNELSSKIIQIKTCPIQRKYDDITFSIITDEKVVSRMLFDAAHSTESDDSFYLIRIDDMDGQIDVDEANVHLESSIILSNLAAACRASALIAMKDGRKLDSIFMMNRTRLFYTHAYHILSEAPIVDDMETARSILVSMLILTGLIQCTGNCTEIRAYHIRLYDFRDELSMYDWVFDAFEKHVNCCVVAAAA